jgi:hypothetical protein
VNLGPKATLIAVTNTFEMNETRSSTTFTEAREGAAAYLRERLTAQAPVTDEDFEVPIIDISPSFSELKSERQKVADQIRKACTTSGFFYITNHGIPLSARRGILRQAERFMHELSPEQKEHLHTKKSKLGLGWEPSEYTSIAGDLETKEVFNFSYEAAMDRTGGDGKYVNLDGSTTNGNMWPQEQDLPGFYDAVKTYYAGVSGTNSLSDLIQNPETNTNTGSRSCTPPVPPLRIVSRARRGLLRQNDNASRRYSSFAILSAP